MADQVIEAPVEQSTIEPNTAALEAARESENDSSAQETTYEVLVREDGSLMMRAEDFVAADLYPGQRLHVSIRSNTPEVSEIVESISQQLAAAGVTLEELLENSERIREQLFQERYSRAVTG